MTTANMNLTLPTPTITTGPLWANELNSNLSLIDAHDHTTGKGMLVPVAGLDINDNLPMGSAYGIEQARYVRLAPAGGAVPDTSLFRLSINGNLYYNNDSGIPVQITNGNSIASPVNGGFSGLSAPAAAIYSGGSFEFWADQPGDVPGSLLCGPIATRRATAGSPVLTLTPSSLMVSGYTITWPTSLPLSQALLSISPSGELSSAIPDGSSIEISSGYLQIANGGVDTAQLEDDSVTTIKIDDGAVTQAKLGAPVFAQSSVDSGAYSASTPTTPATEITSLEIASVTLAANRPVMLGLQASALSPANNAYIRTQTHHTKLYFFVTEPGGGTSFVIGQVEIDTGAYFPPSTLTAWFVPSVSGAWKVEVFSVGVGGTSTLSVNYCRSYVYQF